MRKVEAPARSIRVTDDQGSVTWQGLRDESLPQEPDGNTSVLPANIMVDALWLAAGKEDYVYLRGLMELVGLSQAMAARLAGVHPNEVGFELRGQRPLDQQFVSITGSLIRSLLGSMAWIAGELGVEGSPESGEGQYPITKVGEIAKALGRKGKRGRRA